MSFCCPSLTHVFTVLLVLEYMLLQISGLHDMNMKLKCQTEEQLRKEEGRKAQ